ncbi:TonB-dependent receptor [candidate division KSB1 bacterium]|nr:TonB-dependent receptor [candidate division KSB1 bacterium]
MKLAILLLVLIFLTTPVFSQATQEAGRILGIITHAETGDSLKDVTIVVIGATHSTQSNAKGAYLITNAPTGKQTVVFSCRGFSADTVQCEIFAGRYTRVDARLSPMPARRRLVAIADSHFVTYHPHATQPGRRNVNPVAADRLAGAFDDLHRVVGHAGGQLSSDYTAAYCVRGGLPENHLYLDGLLLPNPYRLRLLFGGAFGLLNPATINSAHLYNGFFPGQYGDVLSSAFVVNSRDGRRDRFGAGGSYDLFQTTLVLEGPFPGKGGSWLMAARRSYVDLLVNPFLDNQKLPYMFDMDSKLVYDLSANTRLAYKMLYEDEATAMIAETDQDIEVSERGKLNMHMLALESQLSQYANMAVRTSCFDQTFDYSLYADRSDSAAAFQDFNSRVRGINLLQTLSLAFKNHRLAQGFFLSSETSALGLWANTVNIEFTRRSLPPPMQVDNESTNIGAYVDYSADITKQLESTIGVRYDHCDLYEQNDVSGKVSLAYRFSTDTQVYAYWGVVHRSPDVIAAYVGDLPLNFQNAHQLQSERAVHYILGFDRAWSANILTRVELYYKSLNRLLLPQDRINYAPLNSGEGYVRGFDFSLEKIKGANGRLSALLTYSYSKGEYRDTREMIWIPFNYDRRHSLGVMADLALSKEWGVNGVWRYSSGLPYNDVSGYTWQVYDRSRYMKATHNEQRYPAHSRVDMRLYYHTPWKKSRLMVYLDIINLFNQKNIVERMYYTDDTDNIDGSKTKAFKYATIYTIPFIPSIGLSLFY